MVNHGFLNLWLITYYLWIKLKKWLIMVFFNCGRLPYFQTTSNPIPSQASCKRGQVKYKRLSTLDLYILHNEFLKH